MSHFTVLVIGANLEAQLAPFHEYECTGDDNEYVQNVDLTPELLKDYNEGTRKMVKLPEGVVITGDEAGSTFIHPALGTLVPYYSELLYQDDPSGKKRFDGSPERIRVMPEGYEEVEVPKREMMSWREHVLDDLGDEPFVIKETALATIERPYPEEMKWGFVVENDDGEIVKVIRRTNPDRKWDWYQVGGRWSGMFKLKPGATGAVGQVSWAGTPPASGYVDQACIGDIDFDGMRSDIEREAGERYDKVMALFAQTSGLESYRNWQAIMSDYVIVNKDNETNAVALPPLKEGGIDAAREEYHDQEFIKTLKAAKSAAHKADSEASWHFLEHDNYIGKTREQYATEQGLTAGVSYAIIKDGTWYQRGEMGWFGMSSDDMSREEWNTQFAKLVSELPPETLLTMVDCHI